MKFGAVHEGDAELFLFAVILRILKKYDVISQFIIYHHGAA
jgi:hypothetical protein